MELEFASEHPGLFIYIYIYIYEDAGSAIFWNRDIRSPKRAVRLPYRILSPCSFLCWGAGGWGAVVARL